MGLHLNPGDSDADAALTHTHTHTHRKHNPEHTINTQPQTTFKVMTTLAQDLDKRCTWDSLYS